MHQRLNHFVGIQRRRMQWAARKLSAIGLIAIDPIKNRLPLTLLSIGNKPNF